MRIPEVLPPWVGWACGASDACGDIVKPIALPESLQRAVPARQREFVAGRRCAAAAMARFDVRSDSLPIGGNGEPMWPAGVVGSIAHTDRIVCAAAALTRHARSIGIDVEPLLSRARAARVERHIVTRAEIAHLVAQTRLDRGTGLTLAFSAKEAVYKCLYPLVGRVFDYLDARVDDVDFAGRRVRVRLLTNLSAEWPRGSRIRGRFHFEDGLVWTGFVLMPRPRRRDPGNAKPACRPRGSVCPERNRGECTGTAGCSTATLRTSDQSVSRSDIRSRAAHTRAPRYSDHHASADTGRSEPPCRSLAND